MRLKCFQGQIALLLAISCLSPVSSKANQTLALTEHKRLEASICPDSMNRIAVANDRITQIFGDEGAFESQHDDHTGQVFLKPTAENGSKTLSLTLVTEQGAIQDLSLKPTSKSAVTLIFKNPFPKGKQGQGREAPSFGGNPPEYGTQPPFLQGEAPQALLLDLLKKAVKGQLAPQEGKFWDTAPSRPSPEGLKVSFCQLYVSGPYEVQVFWVENALETPLELQEPSFYQEGDLAISLQRRVLSPRSKTRFYVAKLSQTQGPQAQGPETQGTIPETLLGEGEGHG